MDKQKITIIIATLAKGGGAEKAAAAQQSLFSSYKVNYLTFFESEYKHSVLHETCRSEKKTNILTAPIKMLQRAYWLAHKLKANDTSIAIGHMEESNFSLCLTRFFGYRGKIILTVHDNPGKYGLVYKLLIKLLYSKANAVVCVSSALRTKLEELTKTPTFTIYNAYDFSQLNVKKKEKIPTEHKGLFKKKTIVMIGRLAEQKGYSHAIRVLSSIIKEHDLNLIILGEGPQITRLNKLVDAYNITENVFFLGYVDNVFPYLREGDFLFLSSKWEGFGLVVMEALACKTPVISCDCNYGPREILGFPKTKTYPLMNKQGALLSPAYGGDIFVTEKSIPLTPFEYAWRSTIQKILDKKLEFRVTFDSKPYQGDSILKSYKSIFES